MYCGAPFWHVTICHVRTLYFPTLLKPKCTITLIIGICELKLIYNLGQFSYKFLLVIDLVPHKQQFFFSTHLMDSISKGLIMLFFTQNNSIFRIHESKSFFDSGLSSYNFLLVTDPVPHKPPTFSFIFLNGDRPCATSPLV